MDRSLDILAKFSLKDKVAIVTGSGAGMGKGIALNFAMAGAHVVIPELDVGKGEATAEEIRRCDRESLVIKTDVTDNKQVSEMLGMTLSRFGRVDILVNNVGGTKAIRVPFWQMTEDEWDSVINMNLRSTFLCSKMVTPTMIKQRSGCIINISSGAGERAYPNNAAYSAGKAGMLNLTQTMAVTLAPYNIRVNCIVSGPITPLPPEALKNLGFPLSSQRPQRAEDVAMAAIYLASEAADYVTGINVRVSGGPFLGMRMLEHAENVWQKR